MPPQIGTSIQRVHNQMFWEYIINGIYDIGRHNSKPFPYKVFFYLGGKEVKSKCN